MPVDWRRYPKEWSAFSAQIRFGRAKGRCECNGQCGIHQGHPILRRCTERHHEKARYAAGKVRLTLAHLCNCEPICMNPEHVIAACQRCHLRIDRFKHARNRLVTQRGQPHTYNRHLTAPLPTSLP